MREYLERDVMPATEGRVAFHARVAVNVLGMVERELTLGPAQAEAEHGRLVALLGHDGTIRELTEELATGIRAGTHRPSPGRRHGVREGVGGGQARRRQPQLPCAAPEHRGDRVRIATWNVNSLKARLPRVEEWLEYAQPDVLCLQETKLSDKNFPAMAFSTLGYESAHHGHNQWNGVAILSKVGIDDVTSGFGESLVDPYEGDARLVAATCGGIRVASVYVPNGREVAERVLRPQARVVRAAGRVGRRPASSPPTR